MFGELTVMQWLRSYYRHDRMHYDQVRGDEPSTSPASPAATSRTSDAS